MCQWHTPFAVLSSVTAPLQAVYHKWPGTYAVAACTQLALHYMDDVSLTEEVLLEPAKIAVMVERGPGGPPSQQQGVKGRSRLNASAPPLSMSQQQLSLPRLEPCPLGLSVQARWDHPRLCPHPHI